MVEDLAALRWEKLGHPVVRWDAIPRVAAPKNKPHRLLVVLVEFADYRFERYRGEPGQGTKLAAFYQKQLFDPDYQRANSLSHYYAEQSRGAYHVEGLVLEPVRLSKPRRAYGSPNRPAGGMWRDDVDPPGMIDEALTLAAKSAGRFPAAEFDRWDPNDYDKDGVTDEPDGYLDHFVLVYAGAPQNTCQSLFKIGEVLTADVDNAALAKLAPKARECADRLWPHRSAVRLREGSGPQIGGQVHRRGGVPVSETLWVYDYNMQSEYTDEATFIHEFGHSIGLPDVYSRTSNNSTGSWAVMAADMRPHPQGMSAWSRLQLGWLVPKVVVPPSFGGQASGSAKLALLDDTKTKGDRAVMVVLPPKTKILELTDTLPEGSRTALYGGQGNELSRTATLSLDLSNATAATISMDAWWDIEAGWDFAYVEVSTDQGQTWVRQVPSDRRFMPAKHGHDGKETLPGLTGVSGDLDGDGKNESNAACDPSAVTKSGEDKAGAGENPCTQPSWVRPSFDLGAFLGKPEVRFRVRHYTDGAAVMRGILIDNVTFNSSTASGPSSEMAWTFEDGHGPWVLDGFEPSSGRHEILVPHYYLIEVRDPYRSVGYDRALAESSISFYANPETGEMVALEVRRRPGVVLWYADGAFAWSENDPASNGPGKGYALVVDSNPNELSLPGLEPFFAGDPSSFDTRYDVSGPEAQKKLEESFKSAACFVRSRAYFPGEVKLACKRKGAAPPLATIQIEGKKAAYAYEILNDVLPGAARDAVRQVGELLDTRERKGEVSFRLRDRALRNYHTFDAPFSPAAFDDGVIVYRVAKNGLEKVSSQPHPANATFSDKNAARWLNPNMPFGGAAVPPVGFSFEVIELAEPDAAGNVAEIRWAFER